MPEKTIRQRIWKFAKEPLIIMVAFLGVHSFAYAQYEIWPSESMVPTLEVGDRVIVSKYAYGYSRYSIPFVRSLISAKGRVMGSLPQRGDVVVFADPKDPDRVMIKRVIGLPGDEIQLAGGRVIHNGLILPRIFEKSYRYREPAGNMVSVTEYSEKNPQGRGYHIAERTDRGRLDNTRLYRVPSGHIFAMGDNRDNSADSRILSGIGYVPLENIIGRAEIIAISLYDCNDGKDIKCRFGVAFSRFFKKII